MSAANKPHDDIPVPGSPGSGTPTVEEPTEPREPLPPADDQQPVAPISPTGRPSGAEGDRAQAGAYLTTAQGARLRDTDHSLKAGERGPTLLQDHHLREKITHFDHERIPERVVHARGAAAHGTFTGYGTGVGVCRAAFLGDGVETPVFTRFSTVVGSRGSADAVRDTRGFATKFYTSEGTFDLVGNNMPVFFIQDAIKFPDIVHAAKPHPDREIPQAQSAHDTFWDFVSLHTEAQHHAIWQMSDRAIPRSYRMMEGFGIHTFRLVNESGETSLVKFHWKPKLGVHSLVWDEAQLVNGADPDFHRRDLADAIEAGAFPEWELGIQVMPDSEDQTYKGIDLLDPTKLVPEELVPVQTIGKLQLNANPTNYFAETEQVAFHPGHLVPGIDVTDDPLLQGRLFSYLDTQISRLGGPNFGQIPINRPHAPVNDMLRDGMHQTADHGGVAPYRPNSLDGGCPFHAGTQDAPLIEVPQVVVGEKSRTAAASFDDHFSQVRLFWLSLTETEQDHVVSAYTFELGRCYEQAIRERQVAALAQVDGELAERVAQGLGLPSPGAQDLAEVEPSPALSQLGKEWPIDGRTVGIVVDVDVDVDADLAELFEVRAAIHDAGLVPLVIAPVGGMLGSGKKAVPVQRTLLTARSVELDALLLVGAPGAQADPQSGTDARAFDPSGAAGSTAIDPRLQLLVAEAFRHGKAIGAWGPGTDAVTALTPGGAPGVVAGEDVTDVCAQLLTLLAGHRVWERFAPA
ncbi:catalase [Janibacter sp. Soil728]|uniref:catalase n=1 Tax=Janibacter sp. Soil728 TaxID=1736393 RepID=UPI00070067EC|nr:catalase [Janibacter sp. Soil728]KRE36912.1 catalase [Janibacter sp. Soil728]